MNRKKLTYTFHNPNTTETTIRYISEILAETAVTRVKMLREKALYSGSLQPSNGQEDVWRAG